MENSNNLYSTSDAYLHRLIGNFIRDERQRQKKTQLELAEAAGINRSTLINLEDGSRGTISSLIQILRALGRLDVFTQFESYKQLSPMQMAAEAVVQYRVRKSGKKKIDPPSDLDW